MQSKLIWIYCKPGVNKTSYTELGSMIPLKHSDFLPERVTSVMKSLCKLMSQNLIITRHYSNKQFEKFTTLKIITTIKKEY